MYLFTIFLFSNRLLVYYRSCDTNGVTIVNPKADHYPIHIIGPIICFRNNLLYSVYWVYYSIFYIYTCIVYVYQCNGTISFCFINGNELSFSLYQAVLYWADTKVTKYYLFQTFPIEEYTAKWAWFSMENIWYTFVHYILYIYLKLSTAFCETFWKYLINT